MTGPFQFQPAGGVLPKTKLQVVVFAFTVTFEGQLVATGASSSATVIEVAQVLTLLFISVTVNTTVVSPLAKVPLTTFPVPVKVVTPEVAHVVVLMLQLSSAVSGARE